MGVIMTDSDLMVTVAWYCDNYIDEPRWHHSEYVELDECATEFTTEENFQDYLDNVCTAVCPSCGAKLTQEYDALGQVAEAGYADD